ncbi:acetyl-CoA synthetase-like protein [Daldinia vernicosa]|uniref:acetyl-CoA synthetase-like protein n=1 Tax=Daldinia vernicosa TaxID=114800 RepID=UPI0020075717|nr:acetyl-CoA synthetase-like protein [Daldinia vernicosa]KAI0850864.1 acetyl-CoA synthetase-like protein [Daldinia vernicosa]
MAGPAISGALRGWTGSRLMMQRRCIATSDLSYVEGPKEPPLLTCTIPEHFAEIVSQYGDQPAAVFRSPTTADMSPTLTSSRPETTTLTYEDLDAQSNILAHSLRSLGVKKGDRVAVSLGNVAEHAVLTYAVVKLGAILVPLNPTFNAHQLSAALSRLSVEVLVIAAVTDLAYKPCRGRSNYDLLSALVPDLSSSKVESSTVPALKSVVLVDNTPSHPLAGFPPIQDLRALTPYSSLRLSSPSTSSLSRSIIPDAPLVPAETINIQFTSGTTSMPKAAMLNHTNILNNGRLIAARMGLDPSDRIVCPPPLFHCFGSVLGFMATATTGACIAFPSPAFDPAASLHTAAELRATGLYGVPTMFAAELELLANPAFAARLPPGGLSNLRKGIAAGSSVPEPLMRKLREKLGLRDLVICYGMTETSPVSCMTAPTDPDDRRTSTVGRAMPHTALKIVAPGDRSRIVPRGTCGELAVSGYLLMKGYWNDEARTGEDLVRDQDGRLWMYTGDEARMDRDGFVEITGRIKDLIIRGGENIHPLEIEIALARHPRVREASVVGVHDERYGEVVGAFVAVHSGVQTLEDGEVDVGRGKAEALSKDEVRGWVREQLSGHLVPKYVFWTDEFPKTASGKIQKFKLRDVAKELLGTATK